MTTNKRDFERHREAVRARLLRSEHLRAGPESVSWRINREAIVVAAWGRAILLQLAHPSVAAGVDQHSSFRGSLGASFGRLYATVRAMLFLSFGDDEQMIAAAARINAIHDRVRGRVSDGAPTGKASAYSAHDPDLQRWVQATLLDSILLAYEQFVGPLSPAERDQYCAEAAILEPLLGMPSGSLPRTSSDLDSYMAAMQGEGALVVTATSRSLARALLYPPRWRTMWPAFRGLQLMTIGSLPAAVRSAYGFEWRPRDQRAFSRWTKAIKLSIKVLPDFARQWPIARRKESRLEAGSLGPASGRTNGVNVEI